ncbi:MAG: leucine-rich repeat protein [Muribaculaceae bacterium]|nr:leucine-rich repeat protein [Muribaculaceae bacterium]
MKKVLLILMAVAMCGIAASAGTVIGNFEYNISSGTAYIKPTQAYRNSNPTSVTIPGFVTIDGQVYPVGIDTDAFYGMSSVESVYMSYGVRSISLSAFAQMAKLSTVLIPSSVNWIGVKIFSGSGSQASGSTLTIHWATLNPGSVSIYDNSFQGCSATYRKVNLPTKPAITAAKSISNLTQYFTVNNTPQVMGDFTYFDPTLLCYQYYIVTQPTTQNATGEVTLVGYGPMPSASPVYGIYITDGTMIADNSYGKYYYPTSVAKQAFDGNTSLQSVSITKQNFTIESDAFAWCTNLTSANLSCSQIKEEAFYNCDKLSSITLNEGVTYVASRAFTGCIMMALNIPATLQTFAVTAVNDCYKLNKFTVASGSTKYATYSTYGALYTKDLKTLIKVPAYNSYTGESCFPTQLTTIFDYAFADNCKAEWIEIPYGVTTINSCAFQDATSPYAIKIPSSVTSIDYSYAFYGCTNLKKLLVATYANRTNVNSYTFYNTPSNLVVHVPSDGDGPPYRDDAAFYTDNYWKDHNVTYGAWDIVINRYPYILKTYAVDDNNQYKVADLVYGTTIGNVSADYTLTMSGAITIPKTFSYKGTNYEVMRIGGHAFKGNTQITSVTLSQYLMNTHGGSQFQNCTALKNVYFQNGNHTSALYTDIPNNCFRNTRITSIALPYGVQSIGDQAFADNPSLTEIRIPSSVGYSNVCPNFVRNCSKLSSIYINQTNNYVSYEFPNWPTYDSHVAPSNGSSGCFYNVPKTCKVYVPVGAVNNYLSAKNSGGYYPWRYFNTIKAGAYDYDGLTVVYDNYNYVTGEGYIRAKYVYAPNGMFYKKSNIGVADDDNYLNIINDEYNRGWKAVELGDSCFAGSTYVKSVIINWDNSKGIITKIPDYAFQNCTNLKTFNWPTQPSKLNYIGVRAFDNAGLEGVVNMANCGNLYSNPELELKEHAFDLCQNVTQFRLPKNIKSIGVRAMYQAYQSSGPKLESVTCYAPTPLSLNEGSVWNATYQPQQTLYVPKASINAYKAAAQWKNFGTIKAIMDGDVNGDGVVTAADVTALYDFMLNNDTTHLVNGDQTGDGQITAADVTAVYTILLNN